MNPRLHEDVENRALKYSDSNICAYTFNMNMFLQTCQELNYTLTSLSFDIRHFVHFEVSAELYSLEHDFVGWSCSREKNEGSKNLFYFSWPRYDTN